MGLAMRNVFGHMHVRRPRSACASAQSDQGLHCPLTESLDIIERSSGEQMPGYDFAHAWDKAKSAHFAHVRRRIFVWLGPYYNGHAAKISHFTKCIFPKLARSSLQ